MRMFYTDTQQSIFQYLSIWHLFSSGHNHKPAFEFHAIARLTQSFDSNLRFTNSLI